MRYCTTGTAGRSGPWTKDGEVACFLEKRTLAAVAEGDMVATSLASANGGAGNAKYTAAEKGRRGEVAWQRGSGIHRFVDTILLPAGGAVCRRIKTFAPTTRPEDYWFMNIMPP